MNSFVNLIYEPVDKLALILGRPLDQVILIIC